MKRWFADGAFRSILRNASYLGSSKLVGAVLGLVSLGCAGRGMTPALFGMLVIVHAYATGAGSLVKFQTWQFVVRYGSHPLQAGEAGTVRDTIRFAFGLDVTSGLIGMVAAMIALPLLGPRFGIGPEELTLALLYCTLVPTMTAATPTGVLRLLDRFDLIAMQQIVTPALRAIGALIAYHFELGFPGFVASWYIADLAGDLTVWGMAVEELRRRSMLSALRPGLFGTARRLPGSWDFVWTTNIAHSVYAAWGPISNVIVGAMLGPAAAGLFKIAGTIADSAGKPADLLARGFYPEIMRLDPATKRPWRLALRTGLIAAAIGALVLLVVFVGGKPVIGFVFGEKYLPAFGLLQIMTAALILEMGTFPLESLLYMVGRQRAALAAQLSSALIYCVALVVLSHLWGLTGAGIAFLFGTLATALCMLLPTVQSYRRRAVYARPVPPEEGAPA